MKKLMFMSVFLFLAACIYSARQSDANKSVENYIRRMLDNPKYLEPVAFSVLEKHRYTTALDSSLNYAHIRGDDYKKMEKYVDSENNQRPDIATRNVGQLDSIEKNKLTYYTLNYSFRVDSMGHKKLKKYHFELDTAFNVIKAMDITYGNDTKREEQ
ncbi:MAG: hypothetical protein ACTHJ8_16670 [Mucilaginibacter sp.]|jgi:hypothetical protein